MKRHDINQLVKFTIDEHYFSGALPDNKPGTGEDLTKAPYLMNHADLSSLAGHLNNTFFENSQTHPHRVKPINPLLNASETSSKNTVSKLRALIAPRVAIVFVGMLGALTNQPGEAQAQQTGADAKIYIEDYNFDKNLNIVTYKERRVYAIHSKNAFMKKYDKNKNGKLDPDECQALNSAVEAEAVDTLGDIAVTRDAGGLTEISREPIALSDFHKLTRTKPKPRKDPNAGDADRRYARDFKWYVRQKGEDVSIRSSSGSLQKNNGASVSYIYDGLTGRESGSVQAAFGFLSLHSLNKGYVTTNDMPYLAQYAYGASVALNKSWDSTNQKNEKDSLTFRVGGDLQFVNYLFPIGYLSSYGYFQTDTSLDRKIVGAEFIYEPYTTKFRRSWKIGENLVIARFVPELMSNYGYVIDEGASPLPYDDFLNMGLGLGLYFDYTNDERRIFTISSRYQPSWNVLDNLQYSYDWLTKLSIWLDEKSRISADISYQLGDNRVLDKEVNRFEVGIGVKY